MREDPIYKVFYASSLPLCHLSFRPFWDRAAWVHMQALSYKASENLFIFTNHLSASLLAFTSLIDWFDVDVIEKDICHDVIAYSLVILFYILFIPYT